MKEYKFYVDFCGGTTGGTYSVQADDLESAQDKAMDEICEKLSTAFPSLEVEVNVEPAEDYDED